MRQIIHNAHLRATLQDCGDIYLLDVAAAARYAQQRRHFKFLGPLDQIIAALRLQKREHHVHPARSELMRVLEHLVCFADAGGVSQVDFQVTSAFLMTHGCRSRSSEETLERRCLALPGPSDSRCFRTFAFPNSSLRSVQRKSV